jgi:hypothetical protein
MVSSTPLQTVVGWWPKWFRLGLVTESETRTGRMMKIISLEDVGLRVPKKRAGSTQTAKDVAQLTTKEEEGNDQQRRDENSP